MPTKRFSRKTRKTEYVERPAKGLKGFLLGTGGNLFFRIYGKKWAFKDYLLSHHDMAVKILSSCAVFKEKIVIGNKKVSITKRACLDYSNKVLGIHHPERQEQPAKGVIVEIMDLEPWSARVNWRRRKHKCKPCCKRCAGQFTDYDIWHSDLEVEIIDSSAALWRPKDGSKYKQFWDGCIDYTSEALSF